MNNVSIVVDGLGIITVPENKANLSLELIQHFTPDWVKMIKEGQANGQHLAAIEYVEACLNNLAIPHTITRCPVVYITVIEGEGEEGIDATAATEQPPVFDVPMDEPVIPSQEEEAVPPFQDPPMEPAPKEEPQMVSEIPAAGETLVAESDAADTQENIGAIPAEGEAKAPWE